MTGPGGRMPSDIRFRLALDALTGRVRRYREIRMGISRDDLKKKRLQAMAVVGSQMDASAAMFDRVIAAGDKVATARTAAETAQMASIDAQVADLNEMAEEFTNMGNAAAPASTVTAPAAAPVVVGSAAATSDALKTLMTAQPNPSTAAWAKGDAYLGTHGEAAKT